MFALHLWEFQVTFRVDFQNETEAKGNDTAFQLSVVLQTVYQIIVQFG